MIRRGAPELFCKVGDLVEFVKEVVPTTWDDQLTSVVAVGDRYRVTGLVGSGWDLEREFGSGPNELRWVPTSGS